MKKFIIAALQIVASIFLLVGIGLVIAGIVQSNHRYSHDEATSLMLGGLSTIISSFFVFGFAYVVKAACLYIVLHEDETPVAESTAHEEEWERDGIKPYHVLHKDDAEG